MIKIVLSVFIIILCLSLISGDCNETQININSASLEELDNLTGVGPVIAQNIINSRPFNSVDDLIKVPRIGNKTLEKIKQQGLACISNESNNVQNNSLNESSNLQIDSINNITNINPQQNFVSSQIVKKPITAEIIVLNNSKDIKSSENVWNLNKIATYGFIAFSILIVILFLIKFRKRKTEFET